jgi:hypothetical protein
MLTIAEEFLVLALDAKTGDFRRINMQYLHVGLIGAAVMELALWDRIDSDVDSAWVIDPKPTGSPTLDLVLAEMARPGFPSQIEQVIDGLMPLSQVMEDKSLARLRYRGVLAQREVRSLLLKKVTRHDVQDARAFNEPRERLHEVLLGDSLPEPRDVCLITLAKTCGLLDQIVSAAELPAAMDRASRYASLDLIGQNVRRYLYLFERDMTG